MLEEKNTIESASINDIYYLTNDDFISGTYRIKQSGTYVLTEDILLDFNAPEDTNWTFKTHVYKTQLTTCWHFYIIVSKLKMDQKGTT